MARLQHLITQNWFEKIFALLLALMLWVAIASETSSEIGLEVPLEYRNIPVDLEIVNETTKTVEVRLRASSNLVRRVSVGDVSATVDLSKIEAGENVIPLTPHNVRAPFDIEVVRVNPSRVRLDLERTVSRTVPVLPKVQGQPAPGYEVGQILVRPSKVEVQGPDSRVAGIQEVSTEPINIDSKSADIQVLVDLDVSDPLIRLQQITTVQVRVEIRPKSQD